MLITDWIISNFMDLHANIILGLQYISKYYSFDIKNYRIKYYEYKIWKIMINVDTLE